jgi:hypothetical protein
MAGNHGNGARQPRLRDGQVREPKARVDRVMALVKVTRAQMCEPVSFDPCSHHDENGLPT